MNKQEWLDFYVSKNDEYKMTIRELRRQLAEKDEEIETLKKKLKSTQIVNDSFLCIVQNHKDFNNVVNEVLLQVKPIKLRTQIANDFFQLIAAKEQQIRHQVCEKIRDKLKNHYRWADGHYKVWYLSEADIDTLLDQIEKGEKDD